MDDRPNVLVIMTDQHSKYHLGCYGDPVVLTPHLDRLAERGIRFDSAYCAAPVCVPSRMSFMTGRRPSANRVWTNSHILSSAIPTWAHALGAAGYETALLGRMHFIGPDQRHGFEKRPIGQYLAVHPGADIPGGPRFVKTHGTSGQRRHAVECSGYGSTSYQANDDLVTEAACAYLRERGRERGGRPFAAVVGFQLPHCPFFAPRELFEYYYERVDVPLPTADEIACEPEAIKRFKRQRDIEKPLPPERIRIARAAYFGLCEYVDARAGEVLETLEDAGLAENTMVVYCSDHGEMAGEHGCWWKSNYYEGSVGVPLIFSLPGAIPEGTSSDTICSLMDVGPTLVEMAGGDAMPATDGRSLWPEATGGTDPERTDETFSEGKGEARMTTSPSRMVRSGPWKLYKYWDETPPALFNLRDDPGEVDDLGIDPAHEGVRETLLARLYDGWDPEDVTRRCRELERDFDLIKRWGSVVQPPHEDVLPVPEDTEDVVVL